MDTKQLDTKQLDTKQSARSTTGKPKQRPSTCVVNSWNEWDPLRHVIVGRADDSHIPPPEPAVVCKVPKDSGMLGRWGRRTEESIAAANQELDDFASLLTSRGIRVDRPTPIDFGQAVKTPDFETESMFGCMAPRDVLVTVGREVLEAMMSYRCRWFEYLSYRPLLESYFCEDPNMRWEAAPKPRLTDRSYKEGYLQRIMTIEDRLRLTEKCDFVTTEVEPLFDAAELARMGRDIVVQHGFTANLRGIEWLKRHFPDLRIHAMNFPGDPYPIHIDCTLVPLRPGLILNNPQRKIRPEQRGLFERNGWEIVEAARPAHRTPPPLCYSSVWLSMNVLVLDPKTVCVEASEVYQMEQLDSLGFNVIPVVFRNAYPFGGGLHCATLDVYREGECEDYLPKQ
jgi:glycine amidinotransferase